MGAPPIDRRQQERRTPGRRDADRHQLERLRMRLRCEHPARIALKELEWERADREDARRVELLRRLVADGFKY